MSGLATAIREIRQIEDSWTRNNLINSLNPLCKLLLTIFYIVVVASFSKYDILGLLGMLVFLVALFVLGELSLLDALRRLALVLPLVLFAGFLGAIYDRNVINYMGIEVTSGVLIMITLIIKGLCSLLASYALIATTSIYALCRGLESIRLPRIIITEILLIYRYLTLFLNETMIVLEAYSLRAPRQKGVVIKAWGSLVGLLLLRSMDRSAALYEAMLLRGYSGSMLNYSKTNSDRFAIKDLVWLLLWTALFILFRKYPVVFLVGRLFV